MWQGNRFEGASLFPKEEIGIALENYRIEVQYWNNRLNAEVVRIGEGNLYKLNLLNKITFTSFEDLLVNWRGDYRVHQKLVEKGYITFTEEEIDRILRISVFQYPYKLGVWGSMSVYSDIKGLYSNGKECYLNPTQAQFINKWLYV